MADISKCHGVGCPVRDACVRFIAPAHPSRQSWIDPPRLPDGSCDRYWPAAEPNAGTTTIGLPIEPIDPTSIRPGDTNAEGTT